MRPNSETLAQPKDLVTMLPCGMVTPFNQALLAHLKDHPEINPELRIELEGNVNHETSYYPQLETAIHPEELPDILVASDINHLFHLPFRHRFLDSGLFCEYLPHGKHPDLATKDFFDPQGRFTMLSANMLVIVVDKLRIGARKIPRSWKDLLLPEFAQSIGIRGDDNFFCNGVLLPIFTRWGTQAIASFARNIHSGLHPAEMCKCAGADKSGTPALFVMPLFFVEKIARKECIEIVIPEEGPIPSPVFMLAKQSALSKHPALLNYLVSEELGHVFAKRLFPFAHPAITNPTPTDRLFWVGWDFLNHEDVGACKDTIAKTLASNRIISHA